VKQYDSSGGGKVRSAETSKNRSEPMDINFARRRLMAALAAIPAGKNLSDFISIPGNCGETKY
jgi:hypothetical protein